MNHDKLQNYLFYDIRMDLQVLRVDRDFLHPLFAGRVSQRDLTHTQQTHSFFFHEKPAFIVICNRVAYNIYHVVIPARWWDKLTATTIAVAVCIRVYIIPTTRHWVNDDALHIINVIIIRNFYLWLDASAWRTLPLLIQVNRELFRYLFNKRYAIIGSSKAMSWYTSDKITLTTGSNYLL